MRPASKASRLRRTAAGATLLAAVLHARAVHANDVANGLTLGQIATKAQPDRQFISENLDAAIDAGDALQITLEASATHYASTSDTLAFNAARFGLGASWEITDRLSLDADLGFAPKSTRVTLVSDSAAREQTSTLTRGFSLDASYDIVHGSALELGFSGTEYQTRSLEAGERSASSLLQWHTSAGFAAHLFAGTSLDFTGSYYAYHRASPAETDPAGALALGDGLPIEPLRYAARAAFTQRFGALRLGLTGQLGKYIDGQGWGAAAGLRVYYALSPTVAAWCSANLQREQFSLVDPFSIRWINVGARVTF
jgi:hypothetical protein